MKQFKEFEIKQLLDDYTKNKMSFSRLVEIINSKINDNINASNVITMVDVVNVLDGFIKCNNLSNDEMANKLKSTSDYMKKEIVEGCMYNLNKQK